MNTEANFVGGV